MLEIFYMLTCNFQSEPRIIPFVAADALVKQDEKVSSQVTNYPLGPPVGLAPQDLGATVASGTRENFYDIVTQKNRFSPPIETEGHYFLFKMNNSLNFRENSSYGFGFSEK